MKTCVKSIRYKRTPDKMNNGKEPLPCVGCTKKCQAVDCADFKNWSRGMDEVSVEWEVCHDGMIMARTICRTIVWLCFIALLCYVAFKFAK